MNKSDSTLSNLLKQNREHLRYQMPSDLTNRVLTSLPVQRKQERHFLSLLTIGAGMMTACLALVLSFQMGRLSVGRSSATDEIVAAHVRSLMAGHLSDVVSTDQHTVKPWFLGKSDFAPNVKDFAKEGFPLIGGRLDYIEGRVTAALVFRFNQHVINVFQYPASTAEDSAPRLSTQRGYQVFYFTHQSMTYWIISDVNAADLQRFVNLWTQ